MKRILLFAFTGMFLLGCNQEENTLDVNTIDMSNFYIPSNEEHKESISLDEAVVRNNGHDHRNCKSINVLNRQLNENPGLYNVLYQVEQHTRGFINGKKGGNGNGGGNTGGNTGGGGTDPINDGLGVINIPVYIHIVYANSQQNISDTQIQSQLDVLNEDFRMLNANASNTPAEFAGRAADTEINFSLAGTFRHANSSSSWGTSDAVKYQYPPITPQTHLNIWICNIGGGILGYAQFPGGSLSTDGVVISPQYFGTTGYVAAPFDGGRTATHEVGHYLNLRHIWGDGRCNRDDYVSDTPKSDRSNYGCPNYPTAHCRSTDMTMNYMDYTNDACMSLFTEGQKQRMRALFASGGARAAMAGN